jgi:cell division protein FtsB
MGNPKRKVKKQNISRNLSFKKINSRLLLLNVCLVLSFFGIQMLITSAIGTKSAELESIRREKDEVRLSNEILTAEIDELKSFEKIKSLIEKQELIQKNVIFLEEPTEIDITAYFEKDE